MSEGQDRALAWEQAEHAEATENGGGGLAAGLLLLQGQDRALAWEQAEHAEATENGGGGLAAGLLLLPR